MTRFLVAAALLALPGLAVAEDVGVIVGNAQYARLSAVPQGQAVLRAQAGFGRAGYT